MNLREIRLAKGITQTALSKMLGISQARYSQYENGRCEPNLAMLRKMATVLECSIDALIK